MDGGRYGRKERGKGGDDVGVEVEAGGRGRCEGGRAEEGYFFEFRASRFKTCDLEVEILFALRLTAGDGQCSAGQGSQKWSLVSRPLRTGRSLRGKVREMDETEWDGREIHRRVVPTSFLDGRNVERSLLYTFLSLAFGTRADGGSSSRVMTRIRTQNEHLSLNVSNCQVYMY